MRRTRCCWSATIRPSKIRWWPGRFARPSGIARSRLYIINSKSIKLLRKAKRFAEVPPGGEAAAVHWLAAGEAQLDAGTIERLAALKAALENESDVVIVFGAELTGAAVRDLVKFGASLPGQTRYMALGDYANSRGAADMGMLPDCLPGYAAGFRRRARVKNSASSGARRSPTSRAGRPRNAGRRGQGKVEGACTSSARIP